MIAREGIAIVCISLAAAAGLTYLNMAVPAAAAYAVTAALAWVYAAPRRRPPSAPRGLLCPANGRVARIESFDDPWLERSALRISVALSPPGITVFYSAMEGKVTDFWTRYGPLGEPRLKRSLSGSPDCYAVNVRSDEGDDVVMALSSRWPLSRCRFDHAPGERVGQGGRFGFVYFATTVELLAPADATPRVEVGSRVRAVSTVLAELDQD